MSLVRGFVVLISFLLLVSCGASQSEMDNLQRRISTLEKRVRMLEGGGGAPVRGKAKGKHKGKHKGKQGGGMAAPTPNEARGTVEVAGDAVRVFVKGPRRRWPLPGAIPTGDYEILASFKDDQAAIIAGSVTIEADTKNRITCDAVTSRCSAELL